MILTLKSLVFHEKRKLMTLLFLLKFKKNLRKSWVMEEVFMKKSPFQSHLKSLAILMSRSLFF